MDKEPITAKNLIERIEEINHWDLIDLSNTALIHYFPNEYRHYSSDNKEFLVKKLGLNNLSELVVKYQKEIGYKF